MNEKFVFQREVSKERSEEPVLAGNMLVPSGPEGSLGEKQLSELLHAGTEEVDWYAGPARAVEGKSQVGDRLFVLSRINSMHKGSEGYTNCNGLVAIGKKTRADENISFLTHEAPPAVLSELPSRFEEPLRRHLREFLAQTEQGTRDYVLFGGRHHTEIRPRIARSDEYDNTVYEKAIARLKRIVSEETGQQPRMAGIPNELTEEHMSVLLDNTNRHLYITTEEK